MSAHYSNPKVSYFSVPKCACTSLKAFFFRLENDRNFRKCRVNGRLFTVQDVYPTRPFAEVAADTAEGAWKFAVVRDPVARVLSFYRTNIVHRGLLNRPQLARKLTANGLSTSPNASEFVQQLERYQEVSVPIQWHTQPLSFFLGNDAAWFDLLVSPSELGTLHSELSSRFENVPEIPHRNSKGPKISREDLGAAEIAKLETMYSQDFEIFGDYIGR
ncbi:sulfotransferase family 2 domain-containing protein [Phaeobacter italicus]|uniref:sulfotransferase family 2 domain-containing protein n=1 Tax=Phaeobacter italicus TaxID=481446 RepID=UPI001CD72031|nr:sulfotransferase family 2 domain-containing protein [Phaeobacter italicus]MCA0858983.1 sulfotransferase family protein [Phaeobacter italicus]